MKLNILKECEGAGRIGISGHVRPDGDCVGSCLALWQYLKKADFALYYKLRRGIMGRTMNLPGKSGRNLSVAAYKITQKFFGFN